MDKIDGGGKHEIQSMIRCLTVPKMFLKDPFCVSEKFWYRKVLGIREGASRVSVECLFSHSTEKLCRRTLYCLETFWYQTIFMDKREGESQLSLKDLLSHSTEKLRKVSFLFVFQRIWGIEIC